MKLQSLRFKIIAAMMITCIIIAALFGTILYPFEMNRRQASLEKIELLLSSNFEQRREQLANEIFAEQNVALQQSIQEMGQIKGIIAITVYDKNGVLLASTDPFPEVLLSAPQKQHLSTNSIFRREDGVQKALAVFYTRIEELGKQVGYLRMDYSLESLQKETALTLLFFITLLLATLLIMTLFLNWVLSKSVIQPVSQLRDAMEQVQRGFLGEQVSLISTDEIGEMAAAFNDMSSRLQEQHRALTEAIKTKESYAFILEETNRELERLNTGLERMVAERTEELVESNRQLKAEVAERTRAEANLANEKERLAVTLRSIGDGVISTDIDGRVISMNSAAQNMLGMNENRALSRPIEDVFPGEPTESTARSHPVREAMSTIRITHASHLTFLEDRDGRKRILSYSAAPIRDRDSRLLGSVLVFRDITEQKQMEEEAQKSAKIESLGVLAGGIAHDFNNILTAILGNLSLARLYVDSKGKTHEKLLEAEKATLHAKGLTRQLLTFTTGGAPIKTTASIQELLVDTVSFALSGSKVRCDFSIAPDLLPLSIDVSQICQVINNLVINAIQAMPDGGTIEVSAANCCDRPGEDFTAADTRPWLVISVKDHGQGIPENIINNIFDPYFTTKSQGSGLGLFTSYSIVKNHGGHIAVKSIPDQGATFDIYLPASDKTTGRSDLDLHRLVKGTGRVLVMDDEEDILDVTVESLDHLGYTADVAVNGEEAIEKYISAIHQEERYDVLIMDLTIPGGVGGVEALNLLKSIDPGVKAIVSSGYSQDAVMSDYKKFGFKGVLPKPFKIEELSQVLEKVLFT